MRFFFRNFSGVLLLYLFTTQAHPQLPPSEIPMYGTAGKKKLSERDQAFIDSIEKAGKTRQAVAREVIAKAWTAYGKSDYRNAIRQFNQAWLLDPENGDAYHGFALISTVRDKAAEDAERYFKTALSKPGVSPNAYVSYGRFLWLVERYDEALAHLHKSLALSSTAHNARSNIAMIHYKRSEWSKACEWARGAKLNNDDQKQEFLEEMCKKGALASDPPPTSLAAARPATAAIRTRRKRSAK